MTRLKLCDTCRHCANNLCAVLSAALERPQQPSVELVAFTYESPDVPLGEVCPAWQPRDDEASAA